MSEFYNCNYKQNDIIIGINPNNRFTYLKIFKIKDFKTHNDYGRLIVDNVIIEYRTENDTCVDIHTDLIDIKFLNQNFKKINIEEV